MIVDDENFNCNVVQGFLKTLGYPDPKGRTKTAHDGQQAVTAVLEAIDENEPFRYSLILMDIIMPNMNGYEATKQIRAVLEG